MAGSMFFNIILLFFTFLPITASNFNQSASDQEINDLVQEMLAVDQNRARANHITVNYQNYSSSQSRLDTSKEKLFTYVSPHLLRRASYARLSALFDNYYPNTGEKEQQTYEENTEIDQFLHVVFGTAVFNKTYYFLHRKKHPAARSMDEYQRYVRDLWFNFYSRRRGVADTSGFEHVFVGEIVRGESDVGGMHNWLRYHMLEESGAVDYAGYVVKRGVVVIATIQYKWNNVWKSTGGFMIGTSPEFDLSIYTMCFLLKSGFRQCQFEVDNCNVQVTSHPLYQNGKTYIGTIFPNPGRISIGCR